jgi:hypothetical protein
MADKNPEALFDLDADALSYATIHNRHLKPTYNVDNEDDESEALPPPAKASPATLPRNNPDKETPENNDSMDDRDSPLSEEAVGDACTVVGG